MWKWLQSTPPLDGLNDADLSARHLSLQRDLKRLRYAVPIGMLLIIFVFVMHMRATVKAVSSEAVGVAFERRAAVVLPKIQRAVMEVGQEVAPSVGDALQGQMDDLMAKLGARLDKQVSLLKDTLPGQMRGAVMRRLEEARGRQVAALLEAFPELKGDPKKVDQLMDSFQRGYATWAQKMLVGNFNKHLIEFENIKRTLNGFVAKQNAALEEAGAQAREAGKVRAGGRVHPEQLLALWLEVLDAALQGDEGTTNLLEPPERARR